VEEAGGCALHIFNATEPAKVRQVVVTSDKINVVNDMIGGRERRPKVQHEQSMHIFFSPTDVHLKITGTGKPWLESTELAALRAEDGAI